MPLPFLKQRSVCQGNQQNVYYIIKLPRRKCKRALRSKHMAKKGPAKKDRRRKDPIKFLQAPGMQRTRYEQGNVLENKQHMCLQRHK